MEVKEYRTAARFSKKSLTYKQHNITIELIAASLDDYMNDFERKCSVCHTNLSRPSVSQGLLGYIYADGEYYKYICLPCYTVEKLLPTE